MEIQFFFFQVCSIFFLYFHKTILQPKELKRTLLFYVTYVFSLSICKGSYDVALQTICLTDRKSNKGNIAITD